MKYESFFRCDLCNCKFESGNEVRNDVCLMNGTYSRIFSDVCDECIKRLANAIDEKFPKNKSMLKKDAKMTAGTLGEK